MQINPKKLLDTHNYVVCLNIWDDDKGKYKKLPVPPHDRNSVVKDDWSIMHEGVTKYPLSYDEAFFLARVWNLEDDCGTKKHYGVGFGLEGNNGLFCIDLDRFEEIPEYILQNFKGCFIEQSVSGTGYHIFGILPDGCRVPEHAEHSKKVAGVEFYSRRRFIALGTPIAGELKTVSPETLQAFLEYYGLVADKDEGQEASDDSFWTNAPYPDYYPGELQTDEQVIGYLMNHVSAKEQLSHLTPGHKDISFNARWAAPQLCFSDANGYSPYISRSEVDMSVFVDLMWAFGGNCQRVYDNVVSNPFFYRTDKPHKWTIRSIQNALDTLLVRPVGSRFLAFKQAVAKAEAERVSEELIETGYTDEDTVTEQLTLSDMLARYVHIANGNYVLDKKSKTTLKMGDLKSLMAGNVTFLESEKTNALGVKQKSKSAVETLDLWRKDASKISVFSPTFEPINHQYVAGKNGLKLYNLYEPTVVRDTDGDFDISHFHEHISQLFHDRADEFLDWCAHMVQKPHELPHQHWYHVSEKGGTGRGSLCGLLSDVTGYGQGIALDVLFNSQFNEWRKKLIFGYVEEMGSDSTSGDKKAIYRKFKEFSSADEIRFNDKGDKAVFVKNFSRWMLCANEVNQVEITREDRRLNVVIRTRDECNFKVANGHLKTLYKNPKFVASVRHFLAHRNIEGYMPQSDARLESDKLMAIAACARNNHYASTSEFNDPEALSELTSDVEDFIKTYEGSDILSLKVIMALIRPNDPTVATGTLGKNIINILKRLGCFYTNNHRFLVAIAPNSEKKIQSHVWIIRNVGKWRKLLDVPWQIRNELDRPIRYNAAKELEVDGNKVVIHNPAERMQ